jgi:hypothetical protein
MTHTHTHTHTGVFCIQWYILVGGFVHQWFFDERTTIANGVATLEDGAFFRPIQLRFAECVCISV